jgi:NDP-sugar pyrophosphorylase family protein
VTWVTPDERLFAWNGARRLSTACGSSGERDFFPDTRYFDLMQRNTDRYPGLAVLLAAGLGKRLLPSTMQTPKAMLQSGGRPLIQYAFDGLKHTRIQKVVLVTHHLEDQLIRFSTERFSHAFDLAFCHQPVLDGSAGALKCAADLVEKEGVAYFLISATDYPVPSHYFQSFIRFHINGSHDISVAVRHVSANQVKESNLTFLDGGNGILSISEKPSGDLADQQYAAAYLLYIVPAQCLGYLNRLQLSGRGEYELPDLINAMIAQNVSVRGYFGDRFVDWEQRYRS